MPLLRPSLLTSLRRLAVRCLLLLTVCWLISGCGLTLGPTTEVRYVIVHPGQPIRLLENHSVRGERLDGAGVADQDIGGWVAMPPDHWAVIAAALNAKIPGTALPLVPAVPVK